MRHSDCPPRVSRLNLRHKLINVFCKYCSGVNLRKKVIQQLSGKWSKQKERNGHTSERW